MAKGVKEDKCAFCGRNKSETEYLISGISAFICNQCADQAFKIVHEEYKTEKTTMH
jgi:ATP-dependent Clp protease ATP-binding subunit ClpX